MSADQTPATPRIKVRNQGPYHVTGGLPLRRKGLVETEHGQPLTWEQSTEIEPQGDQAYLLCRCGESTNKPFCNSTHVDTTWDGALGQGALNDYDERAKRLAGKGLFIRDDRSICAHTGFCSDKVSNVWKMAEECGDPHVRARALSMIERCPSGALTYALSEDGQDNEPDLPVGIAVIPDGPLWVTGGVEVVLPDGTKLESRNRVTLCRCGHSRNKPLCDGSHRAVLFSDQD